MPGDSIPTYLQEILPLDENPLSGGKGSLLMLIVSSTMWFQQGRGSLKDTQAVLFSLLTALLTLNAS